MNNRTNEAGVYQVFKGFLSPANLFAIVICFAALIFNNKTRSSPLAGARFLLYA